MTYRRLLIISTFLFLLIFCCRTDTYSTKPNIIFILVDDLGKEWISCYGASEIATPFIDSLAASGIRFSKAYSMPQCTPSRVALLTGQYPHTNGWVNHYDVPRWGHGARFDPELNLSFPKILRQNGYKTCAAGKWQISDFRLEPEAMVHAGFDEYCMWTGGEGGNEEISNKRYWDPYIHTREGSKTYSGQFGPDIYCDFIIDFLQANRKDPMFVYFPMTLTHTPFVHTPLDPDVTTPFEKHKAMVRYTDFIVGKITSTIEELSLSRNTFIVFTTDNGTTRRITGKRNDYYVRGGKAFLSENGINTPFIVKTPTHLRSQTSDVLIDFTDVCPTFLEMAGIDRESSYNIQGTSFYDILKNPEVKKKRDWVLSMGSHPARLDSSGLVRSYHDFRDRVLIGSRYKIYLDTLQKIDRIYDLKTDPREKNNLINQTGTRSEIEMMFKRAIGEMPGYDQSPKYKKLDSSFYDIPPIQLNKSAQRAHTLGSNKSPAATEEDYRKQLIQ